MRPDGEPAEEWRGAAGERGRRDVRPDGEPVGEWRRLSPRMLVIHPVQELLRAWPLLVGLVVAGTTGGTDASWSVGAAVVVVLAGVLRWFTTTYRVTRDQVQVRKGLFRRRELTIPRDRIRTVDVTADAMHRVLGLAKVEVGTGRPDRKDEGVHLDSLYAAEARRLREELLHRGPPRVTEVREAPEAVLAEMRPGWLRYGPFTLTGVVTVGVVGGVLSRAMSEAHLDPSRVGPLRTLSGQFRRAPLGLEIAAVVAALLIIVAVASALGYVLAFWGFRLARGGAGTLHITRGLVTRRATTIEERRLHGVELSEPLLLRAVGGARCIAVSTGLRVGRGAERGGSLLLPPAPRAEALRVGGAVLGRESPLTLPLTPHGPRAARRRFSRALGGAAVIVAGVAAPAALGAAPGWTGQAALLLLPAAALLAADRSRSLGHVLAGRTLVSRRGSLVRRRTALSCEGIIGWNLRRSFFQRRAGLATLTATTAAGRQRVDVPDIELGEAVRLADAALPGLLTPFLRHCRTGADPRCIPYSC